MSEVPEGVNLPAFARKAPRPTVTLTLTRDGVDGVEVLLGRRSETMRAFPGYWAFPGGGVTRSGQGSIPNASASATRAASCSSSSSTEDATMYYPTLSPHEIASKFIDIRQV